jgi:hypothetical protein
MLSHSIRLFADRLTAVAQLKWTGRSVWWKMRFLGGGPYFIFKSLSSMNNTGVFLLE